jgi:hypothetical protein
MRMRWLLCVLLGALACAQAQDADDKPAPPASPAMQAPAKQAPAGAMAPAAPAPPKEVPLNAVVLTIKGVCPAVPTVGTSTRAVATKTAAGTAKTTSVAAKNPADCETKITRAQFEQIANGLSPNVTPQLKRQLEQALPRFIAMSDIAKKQGLDKKDAYKETLKVAEMQILTTELQRQTQEKADKIPESEVKDYYDKNQEAYEQFSLDRLFIPRYKQPSAEEKAEDKDDKDKDKDEKLTEEQQKAKEAADKAKQEEGEQELNKLADTLRERAANGEDFMTLQKEAFAASGTKVENPTINLPKVRRTGLPPAHAAVFDLKVGDVSQVINDNGGHYIYKVVSKEVLPLDQVKDEIHNKLKSQQMKDDMEKYTSSYTAVPNDDYFGAAQTGPMPRMRPGMPMRPGAPQGGPPQGGPGASTSPQPAPAPAANTSATPATKPN